MATRILYNTLANSGRGVEQFQGKHVSIRLFVGTNQNGGAFDPVSQTEIGGQVRVPVDDTGYWEIPLDVNAPLNPTGTWYTVREPNGLKWTVQIPAGDPADKVWLMDCLVVTPENSDPVVAGATTEALTAEATARAAADDALTTALGTKVNSSTYTAGLAGKVDTTRTVNGHALSADVTLTASDVGADASGAATAVQTAARTALARNPDTLIAGAVTRDANGAATSAPVVWPDGTPGTYTADTVSTAFPGAVDAYHITYGSPVTKTYTQPAITRDSNGAAVTVPAIVVS